MSLRAPLRVPQQAVSIVQLRAFHGLPGRRRPALLGSRSLLAGAQLQHCGCSVRRVARGEAAIAAASATEREHEVRACAAMGVLKSDLGLSVAAVQLRAVLLSLFNSLTTAVLAQNPFRHRRELEGVQKALVAAPKVALLAGAAVMVAAAGALGYAAGARAPGVSRGQRFHLELLCQARGGSIRVLHNSKAATACTRLYAPCSEAVGPGLLPSRGAPFRTGVAP